MSCHYTNLNDSWLDEWRDRNPEQAVPQAQIPDSLLDPLVENRNLYRALWLLDQLVVARFDMAVHDPPSRAACEALDPTTIYNDLDQKLSLLSVPDPNDRGHPHVQFGHLLAGYDAGYYSYLSAQVFAADMFESAFARNLRCQLTWERYRRDVLECGGSRDGLQMISRFLGRDPDANALLRSLRLGS